MKTNFDKYRKCYYAALAVCAIVLIASCCWSFVLPHDLRMLFGMEILVSLFAAVLSLLMWRYSKCPHCGKSVFPFWGSFKMGNRIRKRQPILCAHCGEEVETD